jgi:protein-tyrosine phosphatase
LWLCGKHLVGPDPEGTLDRTGSSLIVCLNEIGELAIRYDDYIAWLKAHAGTKAMWHPIHDMHAPTVEEMDALIDALRARLDNNEGIVVHCGAGIGRAGTVAAAILISHGLSVDEALTTVRASRPSAGPQTVAQEEMLEEFAALNR